MAKSRGREKSAEGTSAFDPHFGEIWGGRWPLLRAALLAEPRKVHLQNPFSEKLQGYSLDAASLAPVRHLESQPGDKIADFCASPGGKLIASIFSLQGEASWVCNDLSPNRVARLKAVLHDCVPASILSRVRVFKGDASRWAAHFKNSFDRILVDAPCSGERHLLQSPRELARWSAKGSKRLSVRQNALLCAAIDCLRSGGRVVYSTCSISDLENDGTIDRLLKSRPGAFEILHVEEPESEATRHGRILLPDRAGCGPIYFCALRKF